MWLRLARTTQTCALAVVLAISMASSEPQAQDDQDRVRAYTRNIEFEYLGWMLDAGRVKAQAAAAGLPDYLDRASGRVAVSDYLQLTQTIMRAEEAWNRIYADPGITDKERAAAHIHSTLSQLTSAEQLLAPLAEGVLQHQVTTILADQGLASLGQTIPPVLYRGMSVPDALIVSPRNVIRQTANISIETGLTLETQVALEQDVEAGMSVSALVVPIGGVGVYPTMIMRTTDRSWLLSTIAHEWTHNYLALRPLGFLYDESAELRTMNETTADIVGSEISQAVLGSFYSSRPLNTVPGSYRVELEGGFPDPHDLDPPPFDFRAEMHTTRMAVDAMLASGRIRDAESYMELRRREFVRNGYFIRRLNQAYFAFYGAYAETPGGPAGADPVGPAVRELRAQSNSLAEFVNRISWMTSFDQFREAVGQ